MSARRLSAILLLTIAAGATWYLAKSLVMTEIAETPGSIIRDGFYLRSARILGTDENGQLLYRIEAENEIEFRNVRIEYATAAEVPWVLNADLAWIGEDQHLVELSGNVTAVNNQGILDQVTEIRTPFLTFELNTFRAETDRRVQIRIGARSLTATGMLALLQDNQLRLKSNVSGKFVP
jgi:LPS export ABC transporter protein LptC